MSIHWTQSPSHWICQLLALCASVQFDQHLFMFTTIKFLYFRTPENFAEINLKFKQRPNLRVVHQKDANGKANSEDPDQTAPQGAVCSGSALFAQTFLSEN